MSVIMINDFFINFILDCKVLIFFCGGGVLWVFGWIVLYVLLLVSFVLMVNNFFQINNYIGQLVDQFQMFVISNVGNGMIIVVMIGFLINVG